MAAAQAVTTCCIAVKPDLVTFRPALVGCAVRRRMTSLWVSGGASLRPACEACTASAMAVATCIAAAGRCSTRLDKAVHRPCSSWRRLLAATSMPLSEFHRPWFFVDHEVTQARVIAHACLRRNAGCAGAFAPLCRIQCSNALSPKQVPHPAPHASGDHCRPSARS